MNWNPRCPRSPGVGSWKRCVSRKRLRTWAGISISEKLSGNGDFILAYRDPSGASLEPRLLVDNKNKDAVAEMGTSIA
jgi:hypothetical protein